MTALRDTDGKLDWAMLFEYFPLAFPELCKARMFGARHYTKEGKDGRSNWRESINGPEHEKFFKGCIRGNISHNLKCLWGEDRDQLQENVHHLAFGALNNLMALEYALAKQALSTEECEDVSLKCIESRYSWKDAPEWALYAAIDANGRGFYYSGVTRPHSCIWSASSKIQQMGRNMLRDGEDWRGTLEMRP